MGYDKKISIRIKVDKIDKSALFQHEKGLFCTLTLIPTPDNQFGNDYMVTQYRGRGVDDVILGNGKDLNFGNDSDSNSAPMPSSMADQMPF